MTAANPTAPAGCPSAEALATFLAGRADPLEREAILAHLDACADCREWAVASSRLLAELEGSAAAPAFDPATQGSQRSPWPPRTRPERPSWWRLAAGILTVVGLGAWIATQWLAGRSAPTPGELVAALVPSGASTDVAELADVDNAWMGRVVRGPGRGGSDPASALAEHRRLEGLAVRAGAARVDLEVSLQLGAATSPEARRLAFERLAVVCEQAGLLGLEAQELRELARASETMAPGGAFSSGQDALAAIDRRLRARFDPVWFDAGALWQSARLAVRSGNSAYFARHDVQRALARSAELDGLPAPTRDALTRTASGLRRAENSAIPAAESFEQALLAFER